MASIIQRGGAWRAMVARRGVRVAGTFDTRADAAAWAARQEASIMAGRGLVPPDVVPDGATLADLFDRYSRERSPLKAAGKWEQTKLKALALYPVFQRPATAVDARAVAEWRDARLRQVSGGTVNRELNAISAVFNLAVKEWRVLSVNPVHSIMRPPNSTARKQRVSPSDRAAILTALGWDGFTAPAGIKQWMAWAFSLALETAMRRGEIHNLTWDHVHLDERRLHLPRTKNGDSRDVPLSSGALRLMGLLPAGAAGEPVLPVLYGTGCRMFSDATAAAGLRHVRFHDARREATTVFAGKLANVLELAAVTGHRSLQVLKGYYRPAVKDLADKLG